MITFLKRIGVALIGLSATAATGFAVIYAFVQTMLNVGPVAVVGLVALSVMIALIPTFERWLR